MTHTISDLDTCILSAFEAATLSMDSFHHREHVRLAYIYLVKNDVPAALNKIRCGLIKLLEQNGIARTEYHETLTMAWMHAIAHFMYLTPDTASSDEFIERNPELLDKDIMFSHYSRALIEESKSRTEFVAPDLVPIPEHAVLAK